MENPSTYQTDRVSENGILKQEEFARFKERSVGVKFKQQLFLGLGGATVFGLASAIGTTLLTGLASGGLVAMAGLAGIAMLGLGCIYLGSRFMSESIMLDQDFQAKKIGIATARGVAPTHEIERSSPPAVMIPGMGMNADAAPEKKQWTAQFAQADAPGSFAERVGAGTLLETAAPQALRA